jgi:hypothetical protein
LIRLYTEFESQRDGALGSTIKIRSKLIHSLLLAIAVFSLLSADTRADSNSSSTAVTTDLVKQSNAPISSILQVRFQDTYSPTWQGLPGQGNAVSVAITAPLPEYRLLPIPQLSLLKIPAEVTIPTQPTGFGDVSFLDLAVVRFGHNFVAGLGPTFVFPTANHVSLGQGKWQAGPGAAVGWAPRNLLIGVLAQNPISFAGDTSRPAVNELFVQPFISLVFGGGWFVRSEPQMVFDWETHKQVLPVNLGFGRVLNVAGQDLSLFVEPGWNISHDGPSPRYFINFGLILLYPNFWERKHYFLPTH